MPEIRHKAALAFVAVVACKQAGEQATSGTAADRVEMSPVLEATPPAASGEGPAPSPITIGFDWGPPCRVPALQDVERAGVRARFAFDVTLDREAGRLVARVDGLRLIPMPGTTKAAQPALALALAVLDGAIPSIKVADNGSSEGAVDIDAALAATRTLLDGVAKDPEVKAAMKQFLESPQIRAALGPKAGESWEVWVGMWTGKQPGPGGIERITIDLPTAVGTFEDVPVTLTHHGAVVGAPSLVLLSFEQLIEGPQLAAQIGAFVGDLASKVGAGGEVPEFKSARKLDHSTVAIDPVLGRPHRAHHLTEVSLEDRRKRTSRDTAFDWSRAVGCVAGAVRAPAPGSAENGP